MACIRLKRLRSEDPAEAISVVRKKRRVLASDCPDDEVEVETVLTLITTVASQSDCVDDHVRKAISAEKSRKSQVHRRSDPKTRSDILSKQKVREVSETTRDEARYKLISALRGFDEEGAKKADVEASDQSLWHLYDAVVVSDETDVPHLTKDEQVTCNGVPMVLQEEGACGGSSPYVFDVYYSNDANIEDLESLELPVRIAPCSLHNQLDYDDIGEDRDIGGEDDDDSNDENNWRNDYPEEDDDYEQNRNYYRDYDDVEDYVEQMARCGVGSDEETDSEEEDDEDVRYVDVDEEFSRNHHLELAIFLTKIKVSKEEGVDIEKIKIRRKVFH